MKANVIEAEIGSCYEWECECGRTLRVTGPTHIQPYRAVCDCGALYDVVDGGELSIAVPSPTPIPMETTIKPKTAVEPPEGPPVVFIKETDPGPRPASLGTEPITGSARKAKKDKK